MSNENTPNKLYETGYSDGYHYVAVNVGHFLDENYMMGYEDGVGDRESGAEVKGVKSAFINKDVEKNLDPPDGYHWKEEYRTPEKGEIYLTKAGNAGVAKIPKQQRNRHLLEADVKCGRADYYFYGKGDRPTCKFAKGHKGACSFKKED